MLVLTSQAMQHCRGAAAWCTHCIQALRHAPQSLDLLLSGQLSPAAVLASSPHTLCSSASLHTQAAESQGAAAEPASTTSNQRASKTTRTRLRDLMRDNAAPSKTAEALEPPPGVTQHTRDQQLSTQQIYTPGNARRHPVSPPASGTAPSRRPTLGVGWLQPAPGVARPDIARPLLSSPATAAPLLEGQSSSSQGVTDTVAIGRNGTTASNSSSDATTTTGTALRPASPTRPQGLKVDDELLSRAIASLNLLPEAEALLGGYAHRMRATHIAQLLVRLPSLSTEGCDNAGPRTAAIIRGCTAALRPSLPLLKGSELAGVTWALASLRCCPPGFLPALLEQLLAPALLPERERMAHDASSRWLDVSDTGSMESSGTSLTNRERFLDSDGTADSSRRGDWRVQESLAVGRWGARKLRAVSSAQLCNLGWAVASLQAVYGGAVTLALSDIRALEAGTAQQRGLLEGHPPGLLGTSSGHVSNQLGSAHVAAELAPPDLQDPAQGTSVPQETNSTGAPSQPGNLGLSTSSPPDAAALHKGSSVVRDVWWVVAHTLAGRPSWGAASGDDISNLAWAYARSRVHHPPLMTALARHAVQLCPPAPSRTGPLFGAEGSDDATAMARMTPRERRLFYRRKREAEAAARDKARAASHALVAAEAGAGGSNDSLVSVRGREGSAAPPALLMDMRAAGGEKLVHTLPSASSLTRLAWAYTSLGHSSPPLFAALARAAVIRQVELSGSQLSTLLWAYGVWGFYDAPLLGALAPRMARLARTLTPEDLARVMWALSTLRHHDPICWGILPRWNALQNLGAGAPLSLMDSSVRAAADNSQQPPVAAKHLATLLWSLATVHDPHEGVGTPRAARLAPTVVSLARALAPQVQQLGADQAVRTFWAAAVLSSSPAVMAATNKQGARRGLKAASGAGAGVRVLVRELLPPLATHLAALQYLPPAQGSDVETPAQRGQRTRQGGCQAEAGHSSALSLEQLRSVHVSGLVLGAAHRALGGAPAVELQQRQEDLMSQLQQRLAPDREQHTSAGGESGMAHGVAQASGAAEPKQQGPVVLEDGLVDISYVQPLPDPEHHTGRGAPALIILLPLAAQVLDQGSAKQEGGKEGQGRESQVAAALLHLAQQAAGAAAAGQNTMRWKGQASAGISTSSAPEQSTSSVGVNDESGRHGSRDSLSRQADPGGAAGPQTTRPAPVEVWRHEVLMALQSLGLDLQEGFVCEGVPVDLVATNNPWRFAKDSKGRSAGGLLAEDVSTPRVAILREGPKQYTRSTPYLPLGDTLLTHALLRSHGWCVVRLPWYEWRMLGSDADQVAYLYSKLIEAGVEVR